MTDQIAKCVMLCMEHVLQVSGAVILPSTAIPADMGRVSIPIDGLEISRTVSALLYRHQTTRPETNDLIREIMRTQ
ncbi:hypothetical protein [Yoonia maricola]|uniref:hypothetical protein n=1 Tax=Yoonia maricola TaxID=420999 RepID=UPI001FE9F607|nr:hypothetical protein [Yoonia maricola]